MLVKLARNWFAPDGRRYRTREGLAEIPEELKDSLPSDAVILSMTGSLPSPAPKPQPGFGAKPKHEQTLDLIPYAAPTHMGTPAGIGQADASLHPPKEGAEPLTEEELEAQEKERQKRQADADKARQAEVKEVAADLKSGLKDARDKENAEAKAAGDPTRKSQIKI